RKYYELLVAQGLQTGSQAQAKTAKAFSENFQIDYQQIFLLGFTSVAKIYHPLLKKLLELPQTSFWLSQSPELLSPLNPLKELSAAFGSGTALESTGEAPRLVFSQSHENILVETTMALRSAKALIDQGRVQASDIALLVTNEGDYGQILRCLSGEM